MYRKGWANGGADVTESTLSVSKRGIKSLALVLAPKETMTLAHFHQMHNANGFLFWIHIQQLNAVLQTQPIPKRCSTSTIIKAQELRINNSSSRQANLVVIYKILGHPAIAKKNLLYLLAAVPSGLSICTC